MVGLIAKVLTGGVIQGVKDWVMSEETRKAKREESEDRIQEAKVVAQITRIADGDTQAATMDALSVAQRGWKDEYLLLLATLPMIASFIPPLVPAMEEGFLVLGTLPQWYMYVLIGVYIDTFGFRRILRNVLEAFLNKRFGNG